MIPTKSEDLSKDENEIILINSDKSTTEVQSEEMYLH